MRGRGGVAGGLIWLCLAYAVVSGAAQAAAPRPATIAPTPAPSASPMPTMTRFHTAHFSLELPAGAVLRAGAGADSQVGTIEVDGLRFDYDFGLYSDPLQQQEGDQDYQSAALEIAGKKARLVHFYAPQRFDKRPYVIGIHFPSLRTSMLGTIKLTVICTLASPARKAEVETMLRSILVTPGE